MKKAVNLMGHGLFRFGDLGSGVADNGSESLGFPCAAFRLGGRCGVVRARRSGRLGRLSAFYLGTPSERRCGGDPLVDT